MTASKRKNDDSGILEGMTKMVIVDTNTNNNSLSLSRISDNLVDDGTDAKVTETLGKMKQLLNKWRQDEKDLKNSKKEFFGSDGGKENTVAVAASAAKDETDPVAFAIRTAGVMDQEPEQQLNHEAEQLHAQFDEQLQHERELCNQVSSELTDLSQTLDQYHAQRSQLLQEIDELDEQQRVSQRNISQYVEEASQELEQIDEFEEERKQQVPRLKTTISLYASTTGIKWDFKDNDNDGGTDMLSGQVAIPSKQSFQFFTIDPKEHTSVEVADKLWKLMDSDESQ